MTTTHSGGLAWLHAADPVLAKVVSQETLRGLGLSRRKAATALELAQRFSDGRLSEAKLRELPDEEVIRRLTEVKGIGPWTAGSPTGASPPACCWPLRDRASLVA